MTLGSEFTFHKSIDKPARRESTVRLYQLNHSGEWVTQNAVTDSVAESIVKLMEGRARKGTWRLIDPEKVAPVKRAGQPRKRTAKPAESDATAPVRKGRGKVPSTAASASQEGLTDE